MMKKNTMIRTYSELITIPTFEERFHYLKLGGRVGEETFGFDRYLNQKFYTSDKWRRVRDHVIIRDTGNNDYCQDLGMPYDYNIPGMVLVHHMNPVDVEDILQMKDYIFDPEFLISTMKSTHDAIHFGDENLLYKPPIERSRYDTCPWRI